MIKRRDTTMPALFNFLYREYCRARLAEMRKQLLIRAQNEIPKANCDASLPDAADDRGSGLGEEQNEADAKRPARVGPSGARGH
jgi:hypothetical protein